MFIKRSTLGDGSFNSGAYAVGMNAMYLQAQPGSGVDANKVITTALANPQLNNPGILTTGMTNQNNVAAEQAALKPGAPGVAVSTSPPPIIVATPTPTPAPVATTPTSNRRETIQPVLNTSETPAPVATTTPPAPLSTPQKAIVIPQVASGSAPPASATTQSVAAGPGGWAIDPATGWPIDPATGLLLNPETGEEVPIGTAVASSPASGVSSSQSWLWLAALAGLYYLST